MVQGVGFRVQSLGCSGLGSGSQFLRPKLPLNDVFALGIKKNPSVGLWDRNLL